MQWKIRLLRRENTLVKKSADAWDATKETGAKVAESAGDTYGKVVDSLFGDSDSGAVVEDKSIE